MSQLIAFHQLTKRYGAVQALDGLTAEVSPGRITAFLGANGSGKTTSMRLLLGLSEPTTGSATIAGRPYRDLVHPTRTVGTVLDQGFHPNRRARNHLRIIAAQAGVPKSRIEGVLDVVGLTDAAGRRVGGYSLGMRQRLALAAALVAEPTILVLDEPFNGLDPHGIRLMRDFLRRFTDDGAEVAHSADDAVIIDHGRLVNAGPIAGLITTTPRVVVTTPDAELLAVALEHRGATVTRHSPEQIAVADVTREAIGRAALDVGAVIVDMHAQGDVLETIFQNLIHPQETAS